MNEILLLYLLLKGQNTMYGLSKLLNRYFGFITNPSLGAIQPTLKKLEARKYVCSDKFITDGGKPYFYFTITDEGKLFLKNKIMEKPKPSPITMYPTVKIKLICSDILDNEEQKELFKILKPELQKIKQIADNALKIDVFQDNFKGKMVLDNSVCEYKNMIDLIERFENAGSR